MLTRRFTTPLFLMDGDEPEGAPPEATPVPEKDTEKDRAFAELRRRAEAAERAAKEASDALAERERAEAEQNGEWQKLAQQHEQRATDLERRLAEQEQARTIETAARRLKFRDADIVQHLLPATVDRNDGEQVQQALEAIAAERPHLIESSPTPRPPSGGPAGGGSAPPRLNREQLAAMTPEQVAALSKEDIAAAMAVG